MAKVHCKRCNGLILEKTAKKYQGYSNYCLKIHEQEQKVTIPKKEVSKPKIKKEQKKIKSLIDLEIENEQKLYQLEKTDKENQALERIFTPKQDNKSNVLTVLNELCFNMTGQSLMEVLA